MSFLTFLFKPLAYLSLPALLLHTAAQQSPLARYYIRLGIYVSALGVCSVWGVFLSVVMGLAGRRLDINWVVARSFYALAGKPLNIKFEVEGEEHLQTKPAVVIGNHQTMLDVLYIGRIMPKRTAIMAKKELQWMPLLGQFMTLSGAVFVDRGNSAKALKSLRAAGETMKQRRTSLIVFPEGTRSSKEKPDMLPFKKGAFHLAVQSGVPITPVVVENYWWLYHQGILDSGTLKIRILPPISTVGLTAADVPELANTTRERMLSVLREISRPVPSSSGASQDPVLGSLSTPTRSDTRESEETKGPVQPPTEVVVSRVPRPDGSDKDGETEEDEGMVLVDRPL